MSSRQQTTRGRPGVAAGRDSVARPSEVIGKGLAPAPVSAAGTQSVRGIAICAAATGTESVRDPRSYGCSLQSRSSCVRHRSPPVYMLRDYASAGQAGARSIGHEYVEQHRRVCDEIAVVIKPTGALWLNLGRQLFRHIPGGSFKNMLLALEAHPVEAGQTRLDVAHVVWAKAEPNADKRAGPTQHCLGADLLLGPCRPHYYFRLDAIPRPHRSIAVGTRPSARQYEQRRRTGRVRWPVPTTD